ncbi:Uncharacterised protein [Mycobacteroides abscessus]|nr:Uncharacterised protein [Mycobacteroides abscessus]
MTTSAPTRRSTSASVSDRSRSGSSSELVVMSWRPWWRSSRSMPLASAE